MIPVVLLQTSPAAAEAIVERLREEGVEAEIPDRPSSLALLLAFGTYRVRVAVPAEQEQAARGVLDRWEPEARANVAVLARQLRRQFLVALVPAATFLLVLVALGLGRAPFTWLGGLLVWFGALVWISLRSR